MTQTIFRIETSEGYGPYRDGPVPSRMWMTDTSRHWDNQHPCPGDEFPQWNFWNSTPFPEGYPKVKLEYFCGFKDLDQLFEWFDDREIDNLFKLGFDIYEFEVEFAFIGMYQVMFHKPTAIRKG